MACPVGSGLLLDTMLYLHGMGVCLPPHGITNDFLHREVGLEKGPDWVDSRLGIQRRFSVLTPDYILQTKNSTPARAIQEAREGGFTPVTLGAQAARRALEQAGIAPSQIGWVIANSDTPFETVPSTASLIAEALGIRRGPHCDVNAACASFARHLQVLGDMKESALPDYILCVQSSAYTVRTDYRSTSVDGYIWGDGAAAQVVSARHPGRMAATPVVFETDASGAQDILVDSAGHFSQNGFAVRKFSVRKTCDVFRTMAERLALDLSSVWTVMHQANAVMQESVLKFLKLPEDRHLSNVREQGNIAAAGCPSAVAQNWARFRTGERILYAVVGAGLAWGGGLLEVL